MSSLAPSCSDVLGVSGRAMLDALVAAKPNPVKLATLARGQSRAEGEVLADALRGHLTPHHGFLLEQILDATGSTGGDGVSVRRAHRGRGPPPRAAH